MRAAALGLACLLGCSEAELAADPIPPHRNGLIPIAQVMQPTSGPHLAELVVHDERWVYVANSNDALAVYERTAHEPWTSSDDPLGAWPYAGEAEGQPGLRLALARAPGVEQGVRCTTLALHGGSDSLYCGSDDGRGIARYAIADPSAPQLDGLREAMLDPVTAQPEALFVRDLEVVGDHLYLARFSHGLARMPIDAAGQLGALEVVPLAGNVRRLAGDAQGRLWVLGLDRLSLLDAQTLDELAGVALDGPALDLAVWGDEAIVAQGSMGARMFALRGDALEPVATLEPPAVVSAVDLREDVAAVVGLTGAWLYDRREGEPPRAAGFRSSGAWHFGTRTGSMLYARIGDDDLLVSDWNFVSRFGLDPSGEAVGLDLARAVYVAGEDASVAIPLRNVGVHPLDVELYAVGGERLAALTLAGGETTRVELDAASFEIDVPTLVSLIVRDGDGVVASPATVVLRRPPVAEWPLALDGAPAPGHAFPAVALGVGTLESMTALWLPLPAVAQRIVFWGTDCAAMWPEIEDLAHRQQTGRLAPGSVVLAAHQNPQAEGVNARWGIEDVPWGSFGPDVITPEIAALNPWVELYDDAMGLHQLPGAAYHPTDYEVDAQGVVRVVEREYRGAYGIW